MKANELRIGNLVNNPYDEPTNVDFNVLHHIGIIEINKQIQDYYKPIELTEEWLIKFGFQKTKGYLGLRKDKLVIEFWKDSVSSRLIYDDTHSYYINEIKYVHQLQNLYFTLTGKEL